ncbi:MAG: GxxExxY protein [Bacteroidota bacterium]|nr:GxxExxY protein [Bacteroidota bacterium]
MTATDPNMIIRQILDTSIFIHRELGPGLFESVYEKVLAKLLMRNRFFVESQKGIPVIFQGDKMENGFRADLVVERSVIVEIKSVEQLAPVHFKQLHTYLKLSGLRHGILINFNVDLLKDGFYRRFNNLVK